MRTRTDREEVDFKNGVSAAESAIKNLASVPAGMMRGDDVRAQLRGALDFVKTALEVADAEERRRRA